LILADTSVWVDHFRNGDNCLRELLLQQKIVIHPFIIGEIALGSLRNRTQVLRHLNDLRHATIASHGETMTLVESWRLFGRGIGYVDAHLLSACRLSPARLWTRDRRLADVAVELGISAGEE
jgi:predicted nucleic acid-binding protein